MPCRPASIVLFLSTVVPGISCKPGPAALATLTPTPTPAVRAADSFAYAVGSKSYVTEAKDADGWYNAQDLGENDHLGEDWNKDTGGNSDCGEPVYSIANGVITYSRNAGPGWGNVLIIEHTLPSGEKLESVYGHLNELLRTNGEVTKREQIGTIGNANGLYPCHLHLELRTSECPVWNQPGNGYSSERKGWIDPSDFINSRR